MKHKKLITGIGIGAAAAAGCALLSSLVTKKLTQSAINREMPPSVARLKSVFSGRDHGEMQEIYAAQAQAAEKLRQRAMTDVEVTSFDGLRLVGHLLECEDPKRLIIAVHGWRSSFADDFGLSADYWLSRGCSILYVEQRGQNQSGGDYIGFGLLERYDCLAWANWVSEQEFDLPVYLCGLSMGATSVLMAAGLQLPDCIHGIIADCGFTSPYAIMKHVTEDNLHLRFSGLRARQVESIYKKTLGVETSKYSTVQALKNATAPVMFIHGTDDSFVPVEMTFENYKACASPKRLLVVPGAEHGMSFLTEPERYDETVTVFWRDFD